MYTYETQFHPCLCKIIGACSDAVQEADYAALQFKYSCGKCGRGFDTQQGCRLHESRWCAASEESWEVAEVLDHRGGGGRRRCFQLSWVGCRQRTWEPEHCVSDCAELVESYWKSSGRDRLTDRWFAEENRCEHCDW